MNTQTAYLLLGANLGNCIKTFATARREIANKVGEVMSRSGIYTSPSWGFETPEKFYNQALEVRTELDPFALLRRVLEIEKKLGRVRPLPSGSAQKTYTSRVIDIDILFYSNAVITSRDLVLPHPLLPQRAFALVPLCEIAPDILHPVSGLSVRELLAQCSDNIAAVKRQPDAENYALGFEEVEKSETAAENAENGKTPDLRFLAIEGNIGAGKTSLSRKISAQFGAKLVLEKFEENAFLPKFYQDKERYAFPLELTFLAERYRQAKEDFVQELFSPFIVSDFSISKSLIFAQNTLQEDEYALFARLYQIILTTIPKPDKYVFLHSNVDRLMNNIRLRARSYEQNMDPDYLLRIERGYEAYLKTLDPQKILIIDVSEMDFMNREEDYLEILRRIGLM
ncbi:MAG: 2-amino-4-hydroxy-6-hydroxymethyldihydropteridine diphosphokinase [Bacteroidales bacterium]|nr:2-amino-4-hydroxy-6-hydroxymethyldihydropteridine diphosphokinase [Bacteroidales bacterium]